MQHTIAIQTYNNSVRRTAHSAPTVERTPRPDPATLALMAVAMLMQAMGVKL